MLDNHRMLYYAAAVMRSEIEKIREGVFRAEAWATEETVRKQKMVTGLRRKIQQTPLSLSEKIYIPDLFQGRSFVEFGTRLEDEVGLDWAQVMFVAETIVKAWSPKVGGNHTNVYVTRMAALREFVQSQEIKRCDGFMPSDEFTQTRFEILQWLVGETVSPDNT